MPYAPGQQYDFRPLFEGIRDLGSGIGGAVQKYQAAKQEGQFLDAQYEGLAKAMASMNPDRAPELAKFSSLSLPQKRGAAASLAFEFNQFQKDQDRALRERGVAAQEKQVSLAEAMQQAGLARQQRDDQAASGFQGRLAELVQGGPLADGFRPPGPPSLADIISAAGSSGFKLPAGQLMEAVRSMQVDPEAPEPREKQIGGSTVVWSPKTGAMQTLAPDGLTPSQKQAAALQLQQQWINLTRDMADPVKAGALDELRQARQMLEDQFASLGLKPPVRAPAPAPTDSKPSTGGRMRFDASGKPIKP